MSVYVSKAERSWHNNQVFFHHNFELIRSPLLATSFLHRVGISAILVSMSFNMIQLRGSRVGDAKSFWWPPPKPTFYPVGRRSRVG